MVSSVIHSTRKKSFECQISCTVSEYLMDSFIYRKSLYMLREPPMVCGQQTECEHNTWKDTHIFTTEKENNKKFFKSFHTETISFIPFYPVL